MRERTPKKIDTRLSITETSSSSPKTNPTSEIKSPSTENIKLQRKKKKKHPENQKLEHEEMLPPCGRFWYSNGKTCPDGHLNIHPVCEDIRKKQWSSTNVLR